MATVNLSSIITPANIVTASGTETLTNKTINIASNTLTGVQSTLVSGTSIKTINSTSLLGGGDIAISAGFTLGTPVATTSGTAINFSGIPANVKQVIISFINVSSDSVGNFSITLGTSSGLTTTGYTSNAVTVSGTGSLSAGDTSSTLFVLTGQKPAANDYNGSIFCTLENSGSNRWVLSGILGSNTSANVCNISAGSVSLSGLLTQLRIQALGNTFDSGEVNIAFM